jgi:hypothetical protein
LYHLLFVIVMKALSKMISVAMNKSFLLGFSVGPMTVGGLNISYLLFANETLIFCKEDPDHLRHL